MTSSTGKRKKCSILRRSGCQVWRKCGQGRSRDTTIPYHFQSFLPRTLTSRPRSTWGSLILDDSDLSGAVANEPAYDCFYVYSMTLLEPLQPPFRLILRACHPHHFSSRHAQLSNRPRILWQGVALRMIE